MKAKEWIKKLWKIYLLKISKVHLGTKEKKKTAKVETLTKTEHIYQPKLS